MRGYSNGCSKYFYNRNGCCTVQRKGKIGKYNQGVNRNAKVLENQAIQLEQKAEFDKAQFNKSFKKMKVLQK